MLLVDSEAPVSTETDPWDHLKQRDRWERPSDAEDDQAQLMVQCMETWIVADRETLRDVFGSSLLENALPPLNNLEAHSKDDVQDKLVHATRDCGRNRAYTKGRRSFQVLERINPDIMKQHLPHFVRLCEMLDRKL